MGGMGQYRHTDRERDILRERERERERHTHTHTHTHTGRGKCIQEGNGDTGQLLSLNKIK